MHTSTKIIHMRISAVASLSRTGADKILDPQGHGISSRAVAIYARERNLSDLYFIFIGYLRIAPQKPTTRNRTYSPINPTRESAYRPSGFLSTAKANLFSVIFSIRLSVECRDLLIRRKRVCQLYGQHFQNRASRTIQFVVCTGKACL